MTSPFREQQAYTLTVRGLKDRSSAGNVMPMASAAFTAQRPGVLYAYYERGQEPKGDELARFEELTARKTGVVETFDLSVRARDQNFAVRFDGLIEAAAGGEYTFYTTSDDGSRLYVDGRLVVKNDGMHGMVEQSGKVTLGAGRHPITVTLYQGGGGFGLSAQWAGPGLQKQEIPASALHHMPRAGEAQGP